MLTQHSIKALNQADTQLKITEIFYSLQGEAMQSGLPTIFIRLTGCPLRCRYCDTEYAFTGGQFYSFDDLLSTLDQYPVKRVCVTGGEPLAQVSCYPFLDRLIDLGYQVSLETSGSLSIERVNKQVNVVLDFKTPESDEADKNYWKNLEYLKPTDQIKFVIQSLVDYEWCKQQIELYDLSAKATLLMSASTTGTLTPTELADAIIKDGLDVRFQMQLHKILWGDKTGV